MWRGRDLTFCGIGVDARVVLCIITASPSWKLGVRGGGSAISGGIYQPDCEVPPSGEEGAAKISPSVLPRVGRRPGDPELFCQESPPMVISLYIEGGGISTDASKSLTPPPCTPGWAENLARIPPLWTKVCRGGPKFFPGSPLGGGGGGVPTDAGPDLCRSLYRLYMTPIELCRSYHGYREPESCQMKRDDT